MVKCVNNCDVLFKVPVENNIEKTLCCWLCTSGPISISARTDRRGYCPGKSHFTMYSPITVQPIGKPYFCMCTPITVQPIGGTILLHVYTYHCPAHWGNHTSVCVHLSRSNPMRKPHFSMYTRNTVQPIEGTTLFYVYT